MAKVIKLGKKDDIASVIQKIKNLKDKEVTFELEKGSVLLSSSANLKLMKKTGEVLGKTVLVSTDDEIGQILARKAEVLAEDAVAKGPVRVIKPNVRKNSAGSGFSDISGPRRILPNSTAKTLRSSYMPAVIPVIPGAALGKKIIPSVKMPRFANSNFGRAFVFAVAVLVVSAFGVAVLLPQASITVYARSEPITRDMEVQVDKDVQTTDLNNSRVPGQLVTKEVSHTQSFETTGTKQTGEKSTGNVTLYNFTKNTLTLKAATTTLVANGKNYRFTRDVTGLRPTSRIGSGSNQEVDESSLIAPVPIVAENPGEEYNLAANTRFQIVNAALGNTAEVYGENKAAVTGGAAKTVKILSQADIDRAAAEMPTGLAIKVEETLSADGSVKMIPSGMKQEILAQTTSKNVNEETDKFDMTIIARITGLAFAEQDVKDIVVEKINSVLSSDKYLLESANQELVPRYKSVDLEAGRGVLAVHFETVVAYKVNDDNLSKVLAGKTASEIKEILLTKPEIDRVDVRFSPFFVKKAPRFNGKINITTVLSES